MLKSKGFFLNLIFFFQVLLLFLLFSEDRLALPPWLQVAGRLHPAVLHLPIGFLIFGVLLMLMEKQFKKKAFGKIALMVLILTSIAASITALFGLFLSKQGDYGLEALTQHRNSGIALSLLCYLLLLAYVYSYKSRFLYYVVGLLTIAAMFVAGHTGSVLTHGENFVMAPLIKSSQAALTAESSAFQIAVYPVLERKCVTCHNQAKAKGKFIMTSLADFKKGGKNGKEWVEGKPLESRMIQYIHRPLGDDDHMPPDGKPQLSASEIRLLEIWIGSGADVDKKMADLQDKDSLKIMATAALAASKLVKPKEKLYAFSPASEELVKKLNTPFRSVFPLYQNSPALQADFFIRESFKASSLDELKEVKDQIVVLNLSRMPVTDSDLAVIGSFSNLEKLNVNFSKISGTGLSSLGTLKNLSSASLAGTAVTAESILPVLAISSLQELFVWNTKITEEDRKKLAAEYPKVIIVSSQFIDNKILRLGRPLLVNDGIVKIDEGIVLRHSMPGVVIRYTVDGTSPDSVAASQYDKPFTLKVTSKIKAIACKSGWYCSEVFEATCFVEGLKPEHAELLTKPDKQYPGEGDKSLADGRKGFIDVHKEAAWLGFQNDPFSAGFSFGPNAPAIHTIVISYGKNLGSYLFPPETVEVWAGKSKGEIKLLKTMKVEQPFGYDPQQVEALVVPLTGTRYAYYKVVAKPVGKLPQWHSGKGKKGWIFVDEVFFY